MSDEADVGEDSVNLVNPEGQLVSVPAGQHQDALKVGYTTPDQATLENYKYGTGGQQLLTGVESGLSAATFGASRGIERLASNFEGLEDLSPEAQRKREKINPTSSFVGSGLGLAASSAIPGLGAAGLLEKAGLGGAEFVGLGAEAAGAKAAANATQAAIEAGATGKAVTLAANAAKRAAFSEFGTGARIASTAAKSAIEGMVFQGGNEVGKMLLSDPDQHIGTVAANIGLAGIIGGGIGGTLGGGKELWNAKFGNKVTNALSDAIDQSGSPLSGEFNTGAPTEVSLDGKVSNPQELLEAGLRRGVDLREAAPEALSSDPLIRNMAGNLAERPTVFGVMKRNERKGVVDAIKGAFQGIFRDATDRSEASVGKEIREGMTASVEQEFKDNAAKFNELKPVFKNIEVTPEARAAAIEPVLNHEFVSQGPKYQKLADDLAERIGNVKNVDQLKTTRTLINKELHQAYITGDPATGILQTAKDQLTNLRDTSIASYGEGVGGEAPRLSTETIAKIRAADAEYAALKKKLLQLGVESGTGKLNDVRSMIDRFKKTSDESFTKRVFDTGDINQMRFFKDNYPKEFELARRYKLSDIREKATSEAMGELGKLNMGSALKQLGDNGIGPEARELLFDGKNLQDFEDAKLLFRAFPGAQNTSATSYAEAFAKMFSPSGAVQTATDAAQYAFLRAQPYLLKAAEAAGGGDAAHLAALKFAATPGAKPDAGAFKSMVGLIEQSIKGENLIGKSIRNVFKEGETVLPSHLIPDDKSKEKLNKKLKDLQANNEPLLNVGDQVGAYLPEHSGAVAQVAMQSVNYLNSIRPSTDKQSPLDSEVKPSDVAKADFDNALAIAQQPLLVLKNIKSGNVTQKDLMHLKSMYPALYTKLQGSLQKEMIDAVHKNQVIPYKTRLGLSVFLGQPLDSTMTPNAIMAAQPKPMNVKPQGQGQQSSRGAHSMKALSKLPGSFQTPQQAREASKLRL